MEELSLRELILNTLNSVGVMGVMGYLCKDIILKYYEKRITVKFEKDLEEFRSEIREKETHIALINGYLADLSRNRSMLKNDKQLNAAEDCLSLIKILNKTSFMIQLLERVNFKAVYAENRELELQKFSEQLFHDCNIEDILKEIKEFNINNLDLYLDDASLNGLRIFQGITLSAIVMVTAFKDKTTQFLKKEDKELVGFIIKYLPRTKDSFEKYGDEYMFSLHSYFSEQTLASLRNFVSGGTNNDDIVNIQKITMTTRKIYSDLPEDLKI